MSFLLGSVEQAPNANPDTTALQNNLVKFLQGGDGFNRLFPGTEVNPEDMAPYLQLFTQQNARNFAQAKESAGNLTGSGFANTLGARAGEANAEQGAWLANLFEQRRMADANRAAGLMLGALNSNAGGVTTMYQPGFLDYALQGAGALAGAGAFNGMFGGGGGMVNGNSVKG